MHRAELGDHAGHQVARGATVTQTGTAAGAGPVSSASGAVLRPLPEKG